MSLFFGRRILNKPVLGLHLGDPLGGLVAMDDVTIELDNTDRNFNGVDLRGTVMEMHRWDRTDAESLSGITGVVVDQTLLADRLRLTFASQDAAGLQTLIPARTVTSSLFPLAHPEQGLGRAVPVVLGQPVTPYPLPFVSDNTSSNQYDYLLGESTITSVTLFRDTVGGTLAIIPGAEYTLTSSAVAGVTLARFTLRQTKFGGGLHTLWATGQGLTAERNFAKAVESTLANSVWGLNHGVASATVTSAAAILDAVGSLYCDAALVEQRPALDVLNMMLPVRGMTLRKGSGGDWTLVTDTQVSTLSATFGHGPDQQWRNAEFRGLAYVPATERVKTLAVEYRPSLHTNKLLLRAVRSVSSFGKNLVMTLPLVQDRTTADKITDYWSKRLVDADQRINFMAGQEARGLVPDNLIRYVAPQIGQNATFWRVLSIRDNLDTIDIEAAGWSNAPYTYTPGTLPAEPSSFTDTDFSRSTPTAATSLSVSSSGVETTDQGTTVAFFLLQYGVPSEPWASTIVRHSATVSSTLTSSLWTSQPGINSSGLQQTKVTGLVGGTTYNLRVSRVNLFNSTLAADTDLLNQVAPADSTVPAAPTAIAVRQSGAKVVEIDLTFVTPSNWGTTELYRSTTNDNTTATLIETGKKKRFHDQNVSYGTTYYYWAKIVTRSGNKSGFSPSVNHSIFVNQLTTGDIGAVQVTTPVRQLVNQQSVTQDVPNAGTTFFNFTVSTGAVNMVSVILAGSTSWFETGSQLVTNGTASISVSVWNNSGATKAGITATVHYW